MCTLVKSTLSIVIQIIHMVSFTSFCTTSPEPVYLLGPIYPSDPSWVSSTLLFEIFLVDLLLVYQYTALIWRREWLLTPVFLPGESHGQRSLAGYSPWDHRESDMIEWLNIQYNSCRYLMRISGLYQIISLLPLFSDSPLTPPEASVFRHINRHLQE